MVFTHITSDTPDRPRILLALYLQSEGQNHIRLGQRVLVLLAHVDDGGVVSPFQLLEFELASLRHRHALQIGHQLIHRGLELLDVHGLHLFGHKFGELATLFAKQYKNSANNCSLNGRRDSKILKTEIED